MYFVEESMYGYQVLNESCRIIATEKSEQDAKRIVKELNKLLQFLKVSEKEVIGLNSELLTAIHGQAVALEQSLKNQQLLIDALKDLSDIAAGQS